MPNFKPSTGVAAISGAFTEKIIKNMATYNERPIILPSAIPQAKLSAQQSSVTHLLR